MIVGKAGNKLVIYSREVLMYLLCFVSHHSDSPDFSVGRTKNQGKFPLRKDAVHMMFKGHSILSMCVYNTVPALNKIMLSQNLCNG